MPRKLSRVSAVKIAANRQNALKSTGPNTSSGKANSRRNALKHGLFALDLFIADLTQWENPVEYQELLDRLTESHQPVGAAEELEVQQIAVCWWRRGRAWRYENAEIANRLFIRHNRPAGGDSVPWQPVARLELLDEAELEIEATGRLSEELKGKILGDAQCADLWKLADGSLSEKDAALRVVRENQWFAEAMLKLSNDREAMPGPEALDRLLRADAATERGLNRAIDRLDSLQRRRKGEPVPPPLSVRLSR